MPSAELADAIFQAAVTLGLAGFALILYRRVRQPWLAWWAVAWGLYVLRLAAIIAFLATDRLAWLFWHQVATGWVALTILWAALVFSRQAKWRAAYAAWALLPLVLAGIAVTGVDRFLVVALPMVALISGATLWTGWVFWRHATRTGSSGARFVAVAFVLWGLHHLDYPFLRARGAWEPWGYFLDIAFELAVGVGFGLMVLSDLAGRLRTRNAEIARLQKGQVAQNEAERRRISRELHDEAGQTLSAIKLEIGLLRESADQATHPQLDRVITLIDSGIIGIRRVINDLRPSLLDDLGLAAAVRALTEDIGLRSHVQVTLQIDRDLPRMGSDAELVLFRAAQEGLGNVVRHSGATSVLVSLSVAAGNFELEISDNGVGMPADADMMTMETHGHLGLAGMRERIHSLGGSLTVTTADGVNLLIRLPLQPARHDQEITV
jgi:signal transduction histidine kinase